MTGQTFSLKPFPTLSEEGTLVLLPLDWEITGSVTRQTNTLMIRYQLSGDLSALDIAVPAKIAARKHNLWEDTCFEFFLGIKSSPKYWEFNLSPAGHWNIYRFDDYRKGMQEEIGFTSLPFKVQTQLGTLSLAINLDLDAIVFPNQELEIAITAVLKLKNGEVTYWALTHPGSEADFHQRNSFTIRS